MKSGKSTIFSCLLLVALGLPVTLSAAENRNGFEDSVERRAKRAALQDGSVNTLAPQQRISRRQASTIASDRFEGRVLSILMDNSSNTWRVRMDREGTVFNVFINASSGDVSGTSD